jgi:hypothetical protein
MAIEGPETSPEVRVTPPEMTPFHVTVHVHLNDRPRSIVPENEARGEVETGQNRRSRPVVTGLFAAGAVFLVGTFGYRIGMQGGDIAAPSGAAVAVRSDPVAPVGAGSKPQLPAEIASTLREPPRVTPPPGAPAQPGAKTGPAAFGLSD